MQSILYATLVSILVVIWSSAAGVAQDGISAEDRLVEKVDCYSDPATIEVTNAVQEPVTIRELILGPHLDCANITVEVSDKLAPGESITYEAGPSASGPHVISKKRIFFEKWDNTKMFYGNHVHVGYIPEAALNDRVRYSGTAQCVMAKTLPTLPDTGGGGLSGLPLGQIATLASLLAAGAYMRWQAR